MLLNLSLIFYRVACTVFQWKLSFIDCELHYDYVFSSTCSLCVCCFAPLDTAVSASEVTTIWHYRNSVLVLVRELTRCLATLPQRWIQEPLVVRDRDGNHQEDPMAVHCFCVCSWSALLGDLGVSRSREHDLLSVLLIYPRIFLHVFIAYRLLVGFLYVWLYSAIQGGPAKVKPLTFCW